MIPKSCPGHKTGRIPALLPVNIFWFSIIGAKLKAEKHALWAALRSAACGGALRRCAAPSAAARRFAPPLRGATRPARCARRPFANTKKMPTFCPPLDLADPGASCSLSLGPRVPWCARPAHGCSRSGWHAACPSTCPAPPRGRFGGADYELLERAHHGTLGPSDSEVTLLQLGRQALRMSSKHEVAFIFTPHDGSE